MPKVSARIVFAGLAATQAAAIQAQSGTVLEEVVVTATKRGEQVLQDTPMSVQAFSGDELNDRLATEFKDIANQIPSLTYQDLGPGDKEYVLRGINSTGVATVGVYYDEAIISARNQQDGGGRQADIELHDLQRVEVLKGPQGTLYGASSMSGTIRFIPNAPTADEFSGRVETEWSETDHGGSNYRVNGVVNLPIIEDRLAARAVGWFTDESGFIDQPRLDEDDINTNNVEGGRLALRWTPTATLDLTAAALVQKREVGGSSRFTPDEDEATFSRGAPGFTNADSLTQLVGLPVVDGDLVSRDFTESPWDEDIELYSFKGEWTSDYGTLLATASLFDREILFNFDSTHFLINVNTDADPAPDGGAANSFILSLLGLPNVDPLSRAITREPQGRELFSSEVRFASDLDGPFNFVVGGAYTHDDRNFDVRVFQANELGEPAGEFDPTEDFFAGSLPFPDLFGFTQAQLQAGLAGFGPAIFGRTVEETIEELTVFGEASYELTDRLTVTGGVRWYDYEVKTSGSIVKQFIFFGPQPPFDLTQSDDNVTFKANLSYDVSDDLLVYGTFSQGFRAGGVNNPPITATLATVEEDLPFDPDELDTFELGFKSSWLNNRLTINGAGYFIDWQNIQIEDVDPSGAFPLIRNVGNAEVWGGEIEINAIPTEGLNLFFGASFTDAELVEDTQAAVLGDPFAGEKGDEIPQVPEWLLSASAQYTRPIFDNIDAVFRVDWSWRAENDIRFDKTDPQNVTLDDFHVVNLRVGLRSGPWQVSAFAKNVFDERAQLDAVNTDQDPLAFITIRPATFGLNISREF